MLWRRTGQEVEKKGRSLGGGGGAREGPLGWSPVDLAARVGTAAERVPAHRQSTHTQSHTACQRTNALVREDLSLMKRKSERSNRKMEEKYEVKLVNRIQIALCMDTIITCNG